MKVGAGFGVDGVFGRMVTFAAVGDNAAVVGVGSIRFGNGSSVEGVDRVGSGGECSGTTVVVGAKAAVSVGSVTFGEGS